MTGALYRVEVTRALQVIYNLCAAYYDDLEVKFHLLVQSRAKSKKTLSSIPVDKQTIGHIERRLFSPNCIIQGSSVTRMTSIGPAVVSMGTVVHLRCPSSSQDYKNGEIPLTRCCFCSNLLGL